MKKTHLTLLIITVLTALLSAYSLAAMNQVYGIGFEWYSQYYSKFVSESRGILKDKWSLEEYPKSMYFGLVGNKNQLGALKKEKRLKDSDIPQIDYNKSILLFCDFGEVNSPEYRIKVMNIAQRGNVVEVKVNVNSPVKLKDEIDAGGRKYLARDIVKIDRAAFPVKGELYFIFKNQDGKQLGGQYFTIK